VRLRGGSVDDGSDNAFVGLDLMGIRAGLQATAGLLLRCRLIQDGIDPYVMEPVNGIVTHDQKPWAMSPLSLGMPPGASTQALSATETVLTSPIIAKDVTVG
jgi:hypothetical protein